jgi:sugar lactone lactonase YvrE
MRVCALTDPGALLGEGPVWDAATGTLWWVDILGCRLHAWRGSASSWPLPLQASLATPRAGGGLVLVTEAGLADFDPATGLVGPATPFETGRPGNRSNDSKVSPGGTLVVSTMGRALEPGAGAFYSVRPSGEVRCLRAGVGIPNALAWSPDGRFLHFTDSPTRTLLRAPWDEAGASIGPAEPFHDVEAPAAPDGAAMDREGTLWVALWGGGRVIGIDRAGREVAAISVPVRQPSACAFGGPDLRTLFITSAADGDDSPAAGSLFAAEMAVPGAPIPAFGAAA